VSGDVRSLESSLKALWERTRRAGDLIAELRGEKKMLLSRVEELESELDQVRRELAKKEQVMKRMATEAAEVSPARGTVFSNGERDSVVAKIKELLVKLESYL